MPLTLAVLPEGKARSIGGYGDQLWRAATRDAAPGTISPYEISRYADGRSCIGNDSGGFAGLLDVSPVALRRAIRAARLAHCNK